MFILNRKKIPHITLAISFCLFLLGNSALAVCNSKLNLEHLNESPYKITETSKWFKTQEKPIGVILLLHGLNLKPSKMDSLAKFYQQNGYDVLRPALAGHRGSLKEQKQLTGDVWLKQMQEHYCLIKKRSEELGGAPLFLNAFSLGSLVAMAWQIKRGKPAFKSQVLLAPAAFSHWYGNLTRTLFFLKDSFGIPSKNLVEYRSQKTTSLAAYRSMQELRSIVLDSDKAAFNSDTLILIDPEDELVSLEKIEDYKKENSLTLWKIQEITNSKPTLSKSFHHLIIDEASLGKRHWQELKALSIRQFSP